MKYYLCRYAKFSCGIGVVENRECIIKRFYNEFWFYYNLQGMDGIKYCDAKVFIVEQAFDGIINDKEECIHSSHSKNKKILLNGDLYTQNDAKIYAFVKKEEEKIFYYLKKTKTKVMVNIRERAVYVSGEDLYNTFVYVFESLLCIGIEHKGGILFHGACIQWNKKGYIITGKSGAGKTTFLFNALKCGGIFHSNDRVAVYLEENRIEAYSIPIPVNVPIAVMRSLNEWKDTKLIKNAEDNTKIRFMVSQLEQIFHNNMVSFTEISEIVLVDYSENRSEYTNLRGKKIRDYLEVLSPYDENHPKWLPIFEFPNIEMIDKKLEELGERIIICKISGKDTFGTFKKEK